MKNYTQPGATLTLTAPYALTSGQGAQIGSAFVVAVKDIAAGARGGFVAEGCADLTKTAGEAWTECQLLYWNNTTRAVTTTPATNLKIGVATAAAAAAAVAGNVRLNGSW